MVAVTMRRRPDGSSVVIVQDDVVGRIGAVLDVEYQAVPRAPGYAAAVGDESQSRLENPDGPLRPVGLHVSSEAHCGR
jgi:hypothetical protein